MKLIYAVLISIVLQLVVIYTNFGKTFFGTTFLNGQDWMLLISVSVILFLLSMVVNKILPMLNIQGD